MKISVVAGVASFVTALVVGVACIAAFVVCLLNDFCEVTGFDCISPWKCALLPAFILLGFSMVFAHWERSAVRVFSVVSVVVFFGPALSLVSYQTWGELMALVATAAASILANWHIPRLVRRWLEQGA